ncbi:uncharacterized protein LOC143546690 [Bidens hawaiensis]|uniref:uncharacterized protein LOC143546690 n=1 Tax=Bidens hawaiensis TaxID=980011 RepID=UPI00404B76E9
MEWKEFSGMITRKFCPKYEQEQMKERFLNMKMEGSDLKDYNSKFFAYSRLVPRLVTPESEKINQYIWGLNSKIRDVVKAAMPTTMDIATEVAGVLIEEMMRTLKEKGKKKITKKVEESLKTKSESKKSDKKSEKGHVKTVCPKLNQVGGSGTKTDGGARKGNARAFVLNTREAAEIPDVITVETTNGELVKISEALEDGEITLAGHITHVRILPMALAGFDVVLGVDWLVDNQARIICHKKIIEIHTPIGERIQIEGDKSAGHVSIISMIKANKCLRKGCLGFMACVIKEPKKNQIDDVPVVKEYVDVFPEELPRIPPDREVEFRIDLLPGTAPIAKSPYRLAPTEMQELKKQLDELLEKGFIRPSSES